MEDDDVNAITWGIFRNKEIVQPTVVDCQAFTIWAKEAFAKLVDTWATIYDPQDEDQAKSAAFLHHVHDTYFLMNVVHNDFISGDLSNVILTFIAQN